MGIAQAAGRFGRPYQFGWH